MLDKNSIVVHYDHVRGEPRGVLRKNAERSEGDCIACSLCVQVCPTGIDIKDGTQMECVNCTACMDVCDEVMEKVGFEKGLIRYASFNQIEQGSKFSFSPRVIAYSAVLVLLLGVLGFSFSGRSPIEATLLRTKGTMYQLKEDSLVTNLYNIQLINKTHEAHTVEIRLMSPSIGRIVMVGKNLEIEDQGIANGSFFIEIPREQIEKMKQKIEVGIFDGDQLLDKVESTFLGPPMIK